jgi:hypothetical protein
MGLVSKRPEDEEQDQDGSEIQITGFGDLDGNGPVPVGIDLTTWGEVGRTALDERLHLLQAPHAWNDVILVIDQADMAWIARIIEQVEDERTLPLDPEADQIAYDLEGWDDENRSLLVHGLQAQAIPFGIDGEELVVHEADEEHVDTLVDIILEPDAEAPDGGAPDGGAPDGETPVGDEARAELMGELFIVADRLVHSPLDADARQELAAGAAEAATSAPPYGVDARWWKGIGEQGAALVALLGAATDEEEMTAAAAGLRDALRPNV